MNANATPNYLDDRLHDLSSIFNVALAVLERLLKRSHGALSLSLPDVPVIAFPASRPNHMIPIGEES